MLQNIILSSDSYKTGHHLQYPQGTENIFSYFESRVGAQFDYTIFFGLQYIMKKYLEGCIVTKEKLDVAEAICLKHMGVFDRAKWQYIIDKHNGKLPIKIKAVPEGLPIPVSNVMMTVENTDPNCYWLTNHLETLLCQVWYTSTVATLSHHVKRKIRENMLETCDTLEGLPFKLHDFGFRGVSSYESAGLGGLAHLINFSGTDTLAAIELGINYYDSGICGFSIPASEHSTMTTWTEAGEVDAFENMLDIYPEGLVACVSDSYDIERACKEYWGTKLKDKIMNRNGTLVVRPDSGDPIEMVPKVIGWLMDSFGHTVNTKGYKVLPSQVRVIQGDGCTVDSIPEIMNAMKAQKLSLDNIAFGMGGGLLQKVNRDTQRFAFKCSSAVVNGEQRDVFKRPASDPTKNSKRGRLTLVRRGSKVITIPEGTIEYGDTELLHTVFYNGEIKRLWTLGDIINRSATTLSN